MKRLLFALLILVSFETVAHAQSMWSEGYWYPNITNTSTINPWSALTHIGMAAAEPNAGGTLYLWSNLSTDAPALITTAHSHGVKVLFMLTPIGDPSGHWASATNSTNLSTFVSNVMAQVNTYGFDGVELDWEGNDTFIASQAANMISAFRTALGSKLLVGDTSLVAANPNGLCNTSGTTYTSASVAMMDRIFLETYDQNGTFEPQTWFNSPLFSPSPNTLGFFSLDGDVKSALACGYAAAKINIGMPFYGYLTSPSTGPYQAFGASPMLTQIFNSNLTITYGATGFTYDTTAHEPWKAVSGSSWINPENAQSVTDKVNYAYSNSLGGWGMWTLGEDYSSSFSPTMPLLTAVGAVLTPASPLDSSRVPGSGGWTNAGAGTIPARLAICSTVSLGGSASTNGATIRSAIAACPAGQTVKLPSSIGNGLGNVWPIDYISWGTTSNVTVRGAGANSTFLISTTGTNCSGLGAAMVCMINANNNYNGGVSNLASWTGGYSKGTTSITINSFSQGGIGNLHAPSGGNPGSLIILNQLDDASDPGNIYVSSSSGFDGAASQQGFSGGCGYCQTQGAESQQVSVTSISGSGPWTIGITPGIYAPNWTGAKSPIVWFSSAIPITGDGLESMSLDYSGIYGGSGSGEPVGIQLTNASGNWIRDVRGSNGIGGVHKHVELYQASHNTIRDSYFYGSNGSSESYGVDSAFYSSDNLVENNICQHVATCAITEDSIGNVFSCNFAVDDFYWGNPAGSSANFQQEDQYHHLAGDAYNLYECNEGIGHTDDDIHGTEFMNTTFRTLVNGHDTALTSDNGTGQCTGIPPTGTTPCGKNEYTIAYDNFAGSRYNNVIGSVLGSASYHTAYKAVAANSSDSTNGANCVVTVLCLGFSANNGGYWTIGFTIPTDPLVSSTIMLWGNYDTKTAAVRWCGNSSNTGWSTTCSSTSEVPSGLSLYANPVPATQTLPASLYLSAKPPFWTSMPWPAVGPDVNGGDIPNYGGHAYENPANYCYHHQMGGVDDGSSGLLSFDAYASTGSGGCAYGTSSPGGPIVSLSTSALAFGPIAPLGTQSMTVTLTNTGSGNLTMTSTTITGSSLYTISSNTCTGTIGAGSNCSTTILFSPITFGLTSANLTYTTSATPSTNTVMLNGNAVVSPPGPPPVPVLQ